MAAKGRAPRSVLVPLDGSPFAERALPLAVALARRSGGSMRLALVHQVPPPPATGEAVRVYTRIERAVRQAELEYLRRLATEASRDVGRPVRSVILDGAVAAGLQEYAHDSGADLVVMTTHGRGPVQRAWLGSVADRLVRTLDIPVLLVPAPGPADGSGGGPVAREPSLGRVLVPLDGSPRAEAVLETASAVARLFDAELHLVQVVPPVALAVGPMMAASGELDMELTGIRKATAQDYLDDVADRLRTQGVRATATAVLGGAVAATLLDLARPGETDLMAIATHGRGGVPRLVLGSVADKLVRAAETPVLVVRPRGRGGRSG